MIDSDTVERVVERVIIQFGSFERRDRWVEDRPQFVVRVYKREPWVAAQINSEVRQALSHESDVKVVADAKLSPM
ncbi:MAG: hypothetical protein AB7O68_21550 [Pirellulales bacterium]